MNDVSDLLLGRQQPGVHQLETDLATGEIATAVRDAGWSFGHLNGQTTAPDKGAVLRELGEALDFPEHYGVNFDALHDCLREVGDPGARGLVLLWDGWQAFAEADRRSFDVVVEILTERAESGASPFAVLLRT